MKQQLISKILESIAESLELPDSAYERARSRYEDMARWLRRDGANCKINKPHIFPQGSFRLGTATYPVDENAPYDLDLACELTEGIFPHTHTQCYLKRLIGKEIEAYRDYNSIKSPIEEKHRCWRLKYADDLSFYMDIVPCIPADSSKRAEILNYLIRSGVGESLSQAISGLTVNITDDRHPEYDQICDRWLISNPEGYARWFESRARLAEQFLAERIKLYEAANIEELPTFMWKTPLQRCVQILKRHRDQTFKDNHELKPASILITTLAAKAYNGESNLYDAMNSILSNMGNYVNKEFPKVPNPANPKRIDGGEDFADKWLKKPELEKHFWNWLEKAKSDFQKLGASVDLEELLEDIRSGFSSRINAKSLERIEGISSNKIEDSLYTGPIVVNSKPSGRHLVQ